MRLRHLVQLNPSPSEVRHLPGETEVVFAPMESLADGLGGLDTSVTRPLSKMLSGSYSFFVEGDLLLAKVTPCFENGKKAIVDDMPHNIGFATSEVHVIRLRTDSVHKRYLNYAFSSEPFRASGIANMLGAGGLRRVPEETILNYRLPVTDPLAQQNIANFLDRETARIDGLISKKERLVGLLAEQQNALITRYVYPEPARNGPRLRHVAEVNPPQSGIEHLADDSPVVFVPMEAIDDGLGGIDLTRTRPFAEVKNGSYSFFQAGDILLAKVTPCFENGKKAIVETLSTEVGYATSEVHVIRVQPQYVYRDYLRYLFESERFRAAGITSMSGASGLRRVPAEMIMDFRLPIGDIAEQRRISATLGRKTARIKSITDKTNGSIAKLLELRSSLITAAVTGQIDVDRWQRRGATERRLDGIEAEAGA